MRVYKALTLEGRGSDFFVSLPASTEVLRKSWLNWIEPAPPGSEDGQWL